MRPASPLRCNHEGLGSPSARSDRHPRYGAGLPSLARDGWDHGDVRGECRHAVKRAEFGGLEFGCGCLNGEYWLDIYHGRKVYSVRWDITEALTVVTYHPGPWQATIPGLPS